MSSDTHAPRALLIDAMGTLIELRPPVPALRSELRDRFGVEVSSAEAERALAAEIAFYRGHMRQGRDAAAVAILRARCAETLRGALPAPLAGIPTSAMTAALLAALRFAPFADAPAALAAARGRGERVIVVSNWDASLPEVLARAGLGPLIDGVLASAPVGAAKPDGEIFAQALRLAGVHAQAARHVGDSLTEDVAGARAAGIAAVWLDRRAGGGALAPSGVRRIASLAELAEPAGSEPAVEP